MSRRKAAPKRAILPDPLFTSDLLAKFINSVMRNGKKSVAERIVYGALDYVVREKSKRGAKAGAAAQQQEDSEGGSGTSGGASGASIGGARVDSNDIRQSSNARKRAMEIFELALEKIQPTVEVKSRRVGGSNYQVPVEVRASRRMALAMRWLVEYSSKRNEKTMTLRLANELLDAIEERGGAVRKREDTHRMAKANQAFAHYRW